MVVLMKISKFDEPKLVSRLVFTSTTVVLRKNLKFDEPKPLNRLVLGLTMVVLIEIIKFDEPKPASEFTGLQLVLAGVGKAWKK
jgi:hypothetical protein